MVGRHALAKIGTDFVIFKKVDKVKITDSGAIVTCSLGEISLDYSEGFRQITMFHNGFPVYTMNEKAELTTPHSPINPNLSADMQAKIKARGYLT